MAQKHEGTCKWFDSKKGYGFIAPKDGSDDLFVHQTGISSEGFRKLVEGEEVIYEVQQDENGRTKAVNVESPDGGHVTNKSKDGKPRTRKSKGDDAEDEEVADEE
eukprot:TRINITY_DN439_c0_g1_i7.p2 TRINITY_DN439_c0_g1~~TRINITY_DN439_c0_g1_i7.p2  ORF type:complete len:105 (+),score=34.10 TRINITY_DN439_c0_g1_i7:265-579(+)